MTIAQPMQDVHPLPAAPVHPEVVPEKPKLTLVPAADPAGNITEILKVYQGQKRECWMCEKIAGALQAGKDASDDEKWHFTTCVLSWEHLAQAKP